MKLKNTIAIAIVIILVVAFVISVATQDNRRWNDGVCPDCGEHWELIREVPAHGANESAEIWRCPRCHKTITLGTSKGIKTTIYICLGISICSGIVYINKNIKRKRKK